jgi:hypothetical protein
MVLARKEGPFPGGTRARLWRLLGQTAQRQADHRGLYAELAGQAALPEVGRLI